MADASPPLRVLLVEDHPNLAAATAAFLTLEGLDVRTALSGRAALEAAPAFQPELVLCDLNLPDMKGLDVVDALRSNPSTRQCCIVIVTAMGHEVLSKAQPVGVDAIISKPIDIKALRTVVEDVRRRQHAH